MIGACAAGVESTSRWTILTSTELSLAEDVLGASIDDTEFERERFTPIATIVEDMQRGSKKE